MSTNHSQSNYKIDLNLTSKNNEEKIELEAHLIALRFLSEIERLYQENNINRKELADAIDVSPSHLTQLFRGHRLPNLKILAKLVMYFCKVFKIEAVDKKELIKPQFEDVKIKFESVEEFKKYKIEKPFKGKVVKLNPSCKKIIIHKNTHEEEGPRIANVF